MRKQDKEFIELVRKHLRSHNQRLVFRKVKHMGGAVGYQNDKGIVVACKYPMYRLMPILTHEYSHFLQAVNNKWQHLSTKHWDILETQDYPKRWDKIPLRQKIKSCRVVQRLEHSTEKDSIKLLKKYNLSYNEGSMLIAANINIAHYSVLAYLKGGKWKRRMRNSQKLEDWAPADRLMTLEEVKTLPDWWIEELERTVL